MPNHVTNIIKLEGDQKAIDKLVAEFSTHYPSVQQKSFSDSLVFQYLIDEDKPADWSNLEYGWFDEEKKEFSVRSKSKFLQKFAERYFDTSEALVTTLNDSNRNIIVISDSVPEEFTPHMTGARDQFPDFEKVVPPPSNIFKGNLGRKEEEECAEKGIPTWLDFNRENWGTKWNSYSNFVPEGRENTYGFETAWSAPHPVLLAMTEKFPEVTIHHQWADEDFGYNTGRCSYLGGERIGEYVPEGGSKSAYENAFEVCPERRDDFVLTEDGEYKWAEEE